MLLWFLFPYCPFCTVTSMKWAHNTLESHSTTYVLVDTLDYLSSPEDHTR